MCLDVALPITHPCIQKFIIFINVPSYMYRVIQKIVEF